MCVCAFTESFCMLCRRCVMRGVAMPQLHSSHSGIYLFISLRSECLYMDGGWIIIIMLIGCLLNLFTSSESLEGEAYHCDTCDHDNLQRAHKQMMIAECPEVGPSILSPP